MIKSISKMSKKVDDKVESEEFNIIFKLLDSFGSNLKILDAGSGLLGFAEFASKKLPKSELICVDINQNLVSLAQKKGFEAHKASVVDLPFETEEFDVVHCSHVIEHLKYPDVIQAIDEMLRIVKTGGLLILRSPLSVNHRFYNDIDHIRPYPPASILNYLNSEQQQKKSAYSTKEINRWYTRIYFEFDPLKRTSKIIKYINYFLKLSWLYVGYPKATPNNYGLVLKKQRVNS